MSVEEYRELTSCVFSALRNYTSCLSECERDYALSVISQVAYEASIAQCIEAKHRDLEQMDLALKLVLELVKEKTIPERSVQELQTALH